MKIYGSFLYVSASKNYGPSRVYLQEKIVESGSLTNIFVEFNAPNDHMTSKNNSTSNTAFLMNFGPCNRIKIQGIHTLDDDHWNVDNSNDNRSLMFLGKITEITHRYVWAIPSDIPYKNGCLFVTQDSVIIAQSEMYPVSGQIQKPQLQQPSNHHNIKDGFYFNAKQYHYQANSDNWQKIYAVDDDSKKKKKIGIIGAGAAGLFSAYLLEQAGFTNYEILEASDRVGGRIQTVYFDDSAVHYQELGAMRIPYTSKHKNKILPLKDQAVVFQLAKELDEQNQHNETYRIDFVPWKQSTDNNLVYYNGFRLENGQVPTKGDLRTMFNSSIPPGDPFDLVYEVNNATEQFLSDSWMDSMATDLFEAYRQTIEKGYGEWSEQDWLHNHMNVSLNATEYHLGASRYPELWTNMYDMFFHEKTYEWRTIRGGMSRFPNAFLPILEDKINYNIKVSKLEYINQRHGCNNHNSTSKKVSVQWKTHALDQVYKQRAYDNVIVSVPFILLRSWHLPRELPYTLKRAIQNLEHGDSCKVILEFKTPFWQYYEKPILGGCDSTDLPIGLVCYPTVVTTAGNNNENVPGQQQQPGLMIASYANDKRTRFSFLTEEEHIGQVLEYIQELHGDAIVQEQYTGRYARKCWGQTKYAGCAWADPSPGQRKLFFSSYFQDYTQGFVFIGEHTDIKQSWISSALHSAIRGVTMVLVEHGYIYEAKQLVHHWNATHWLKI
ncbi:hypothetical protein BDA99DRAFT_561940 [Phascolomyces articulosus]|uniref:Amine oxidase domain-containing protein n=1 Tax=Phascolomyces articulosus TaxID=60185 RepID=A0AAD5PDD1_9FUNG|nr:hypothetical protein BDA99DRAFT_561940 [Phascolomyces articulosus]